MAVVHKGEQVHRNGKVVAINPYCIQNNWVGGREYTTTQDWNEVTCKRCLKAQALYAK